LSCEPRPGGSGFSELSNTNSQDHSLPVAARQNSPEETTGPLTSVRGSLTGEPYDPARHEIKVEIKAVTYHQLTIKQEGGQWVGRVIVDI
jgi:SHS2 domain-containing protein